MFGGGIRATVQGGDVSGSSASFLVAVNANSMLTVNGTRFINNSCLRSPLLSSGTQGKPMYKEHARLLLLNATFEGNQVLEQGGAMFATESNVTINNSLFQDNKATDAAGALLAKQSAVVLDACTFTGNAAPKAGAVKAENASLLIHVCVFENNTARVVNSASMDTSSFWSLGVGGAIQAEQSAVHVDNTTLANNSAGVDGGKLDGPPAALIRE